MDFDYSEIRNRALQGPRLTTLSQHFEDIASKAKQYPTIDVRPSDSFFEVHDDYKYYYRIYNKNLGCFNHHGIASMPYVMEQCIRMGVTLSNYSKNRGDAINKPLSFYGISTADATHARTLAEYSNGRIITLTDSPNKANELEFYNKLEHNFSFFHLGSFVDITPNFLLTHSYDTDAFREGFDIIWENTAFQMYSKNRCEQIAYTKRVLKNDGIYIFLEKLNHDDVNEYYKMERLKDNLFKSKYFTASDIENKKESILSEMQKCQVSLEELSLSIKQHFKYAYIVWNSTNFYEIVASNDKTNIGEFMSLLSPPYVPDKFVCIHPIVQPIF